MNITKVQNPQRYGGAQQCIKDQEYTPHMKNVHW